MMLNKTFHLLLLSLIPLLGFSQANSQYPDSGNKIRLGFQTSGDGLIWRDTQPKVAGYQPINNKAAWIVLDTVNNKFYHYKRSNNTWNLAGGQDIDTANLIATKYNLGFKLSLADTGNMLTPYWRSGRFSGVLPVANGGTNRTTMPAGYILHGDGTSVDTAIGLFWDITNRRIGINTNTPFVSFEVRQSASEMTYGNGFRVTDSNNDKLIRIGHNATSGVIGTTYNLTEPYTPLAFQTSDISRLYILANGDIGIGTITPTARLHVKGSGTDGNTSALKVDNNGGTNLLNILGNGNIGIGTASPAANLQVNTSSGGAVVAISNSNSITSGSRGDYAWYNSSSNSTVALIRAAATTDNVGTGLEFYTRPVGGTLTKAFDISSTGAATFAITENQGGVYVTSATDNTTIRVASTATGGQEWRLQSTGGTSGLGQGKLIFKVGGTETASYIPLTLTTDNSTNGGRVGIGTTSPGQKLDVAGNIQLLNGGYLRGSTYSASKMTIDNDVTIAANKDILLSPTGSTNAFIVKQTSGNVGIGTISPVSKFDVSIGNQTSLGLYSASGHTITSSGGSTGNLYQISFGYGGGTYGSSAIAGLTESSTDYNTGALIFATRNLTTDVAPTERMRITSGGNVGIGTASPTQKLHVVGNSLFNTNIVTQRSTAAIGSAYYAFENNAGVFKGYFGYGGSQTNRMVLSNSVAGDMLFITSNSITNQVLLRLDTTFKVTIGNDVAPTEVLTVVGNGRFTAVAGGTFANNLNITSDGTLTTATSDEKYKYNILPISYGLNTILQLKPVNFQWVEGEENDLGFIAQDVAEIIPEAVNTNWNSDLLMRYESIIPILTKAIQEQNALIKVLEQRILTLENK